MDVTLQMLAFVKAIEMGSIPAASRNSGQTPSAVSKQIGILENQVGHRLLRRTRVGVSLTEEGTRFCEKCRAVADRFNEAKTYISNVKDHPKGVLRSAIQRSTCRLS